MKCFVILFALISLAALAKPEDLLKCLGTEEKQFHLKKELGPLYDLNQRLIAEMVQIPNVSIELESLKTICSPQVSASLKLLELTILKDKSLFVVDKDLTGMQKQMTDGMIDDYVEISKELLLNYIAQIQSISPTPECLNEEIRGLKDFYTEIKYLQEDVDVKKLFEKHDSKILGELRKYPQAFESCRKRELERTKKKARPESTRSPKKS